MSNRTCGEIYYAATLPSFLNEKTEVSLVQEKEDGGYIIAVPTARSDPADSVTVVLWRSAEAVEMAEVVVYGSVAELRLQANEPQSWKAFGEDILITALVSNISPSLSRKIRKEPQR